MAEITKMRVTDLLNTAGVSDEERTLSQRAKR
jgi:hypothetical protein